MSAQDVVIQLGKELAEQKDRSFELWTRLPSYKAAELGHGDYASEQCPCVSDVLREATWFISHGLNPTQEQLEEAGAIYQCPCGEDHSS